MNKCEERIKMAYYQDPFLKKIKDLEVSLEKDSIDLNFIGIDPGFQNMGSVVAHVTGNHKKRELVMHIKPEDMRSDYVMDPTGSIQVMQNRILAWAYTRWTSTEKLSDHMVVIEEQYFNPRGSYVAVSHNLARLSDTLYNVFSLEMKSPTKLNNSRKLKSHFGIASNNHDNNKKLAVQKCHELFPCLKELKFEHHVADALLQIVFWLNSYFGGYKIKLEILTNKKQ